MQQVKDFWNPDFLLTLCSYFTKSAQEMKRLNAFFVMVTRGRALWLLRLPRPIEAHGKFLASLNSFLLHNNCTLADFFITL